MNINKQDSDAKNEKISKILQSLDIGTGHVLDFAGHLEHFNVDPLIKAKTDIALSLLDEAYDYIEAIKESKN